MTPRADNMRVRLPRAMQDRLHELSDMEGVTINTLIVTLLTGALDFKFTAPEPKRSDRAVSPADRTTTPETPDDAPAD